MKRLLNFRPLLFICVWLIFGIVASLLFVRAKIFLFLSLVIALVVGEVAFILFSFIKRKDGFRKRLILILILTVFMIIGFVSSTTKIENYINADLDFHTFTVEAKVTDVKNDDTYAICTLSDVKLVSDENRKINYGIQLFVIGENSLKIGDYITFTSKLSDKDIIYNGSFKAQEIDDGIKYSAQVFASQIEINYSKQNIFEATKQKISDTLKKGLTNNEYGIALALLTGQTDYIEDRVLSSFRNVGIAHIFAVSGLHIGIIATFLTFVLNKLKVNKKVSYFVVVLFCLFYSGVCGFSSSSVRATIMFAVLNFASIYGFKYDSVSSISLAASIILLFSPLQLFCVGFQLSFVVVTGIVLLSRTIQKALKFLPEKISGSLSTCISAQLFSIPVCITYFNKTSLIAVLVNVLFLPIVSAFFVFLFISTFISLIIGYESIILFPSLYVIKAIVYIIGKIDISFFTVSGIIVGGFSVLFYLVFVLRSGIVNISRKTNGILSVVLSCVFVLGSVALTVNADKSSLIMISSTDNQNVVLLKDKTKSSLVFLDCDSGVDIYGLKSLAYYSKVNSVDSIIILGLNSVDVQNFYTKVRTVIKAKNIFCYGEKIESMILVMKESFNVDLIYYKDESVIADKNTAYFLLQSGYGINVSVNNKQITMFSKLNSYNYSKSSISEKQEILIASNFFDKTFTDISSNNKIPLDFYGDYICPKKVGIMTFYL